MKLNFIVISILLFSFSCKNEVNSPEFENSNSNSESISEVEIKKEYLSQASLLSFLKNTSSISHRNKFPKPFNQFEFNKVIAYEFDGRKPMMSAYNLEHKRFSLVTYNQKEINLKQLNFLVKHLSKNKTYGNTTAACFEPKLGIIFFKDMDAQFVIDICLDCNFLKSSIEIPATNFKMRKFENAEGYPLKGFSKKGMEGIVKFSKDLNFEYANFKPGIFHQD